MKAVFRADASVVIGSGHLMRCLTLAKMLRKNGASVTFVTRDLGGDFSSLVENENFPLIQLPVPKEGIVTAKEHEQWLGVEWQMDAEDTIASLQNVGSVDWLIVDHYGIDNRWERFIRPFVSKIMVIDDLADRLHDCDLLLDQNYYDNMHTRYDGLVAPSCQMLLGPQYALLREEFTGMVKKGRIRDGEVKRILVFFGGSDPTNETMKTLEALRSLTLSEIVTDVVVGVGNPAKEQVKQFCSEMPNTNYHCQIENMAELMMLADLSIGAGGSTTWERCYLGLPTIIIMTASNQVETTKALAKNQIVWNLGFHSDVTVEEVRNALREVLKHTEKVRELSFKAKKFLERERNDDLIRTLLGVNDGDS
ncbi:MAG: UDP-2,4-diacetamido-2,4,6-trideoxy-beta-L-altropyranose hydrolase [Clostridia bacterium]